MTKTKKEYLDALTKANVDEETSQLFESLIKSHFSMIDHMKETSLFDVYMYEERIEKFKLVHMDMIIFENHRLNKEVNDLRKKLGLTKKYRD